MHKCTCINTHTRARTGIPLSIIVKDYGWGAYFSTLVAACGLALVLLWPMMNLPSQVRDALSPHSCLSHPLSECASSTPAWICLWPGAGAAVAHGELAKPGVCCSLSPLSSVGHSPYQMCKHYCGIDINAGKGKNVFFAQDAQCCEHAMTFTFIQCATVAPCMDEKLAPCMVEKMRAS